MAASAFLGNLIGVQTSDHLFSDFHKPRKSFYSKCLSIKRNQHKDAEHRTANCSFCSKKISNCLYTFEISCCLASKQNSKITVHPHRTDEGFLLIWYTTKMSPDYIHPPLLVLNRLGAVPRDSWGELSPADAGSVEQFVYSTIRGRQTQTHPDICNSFTSK